MEHRFDGSFVRSISIKRNVPIVDLILESFKELSLKGLKKTTLIGVCPNSISVVKSALRSAKMLGAPIMFAATLNQVDLDGGYTTWNQRDFIKTIRKESEEIGFNGPTIIALDHGGPWVKDRHVIEKMGLKEAMDWTKKSLIACLEAGYDLLHIDTTIDNELPKDHILSPNIIAERSLELIEYAEKERERRNLPPISYEVGTEEVGGKPVDSKYFRKFLDFLKKGISEKNMDSVWPIFIVGNVGTNLHTTYFDSERAKNLVKIAQEYNSYLKGHYTDFVENPEEYPKTGMGGANVGPEFSQIEYNELKRLARMEEKFAVKGKILTSNLIQTLKEDIVNSNRWKKWLLKGEKNLDFFEMSQERQEWIMQTCSRYVWANRNVVEAREFLYRNLENMGINSKPLVLEAIGNRIIKYLKAFNLESVTYYLNKILM